MSEPMVCPKCGSTHVDRVEVDIGVGTQYGPWQCYECDWAEDDGMSVLKESESKVSDLERAIEHVEAWLDETGERSEQRQRLLAQLMLDATLVHLDPALVRLVTDAARGAL